MEQRNINSLKTDEYEKDFTRSFVLVEFNLTLVFTSFRVDETQFLLATEDGRYITLEQDHETYIDTQYYGD